MRISDWSSDVCSSDLRRLVEAARERRHSVRVLDPLRCYMRISVEGFDLRYKGRPIAGYNAVIPHIGASITRYGNAVLHPFELMGRDRKSVVSGKRGSERVDLGGRRIIKKKNLE